MDSGAWQATVHKITRVRQDLVTKPPPPLCICSYHLDNEGPRRDSFRNINDTQFPRGRPESVSHIRCFVTPWPIAHQAPLSMEFSREECSSALPYPSPGDLPNPGIELRSPALQVESLSAEPQGEPD